MSIKKDNKCTDIFYVFNLQSNLFVFRWSTCKQELDRNPTGLLTPSRRTVDLYKHYFDVYDWEA